MNSPTALPLMDIKKAFLKILYEDALQGKFRNYQIVLIKEVSEFLNREHFNGTEMETLRPAIMGLMEDGYIELIRNTNNKYKLTKKGINEATKNFNDMKLPRFNLNGLHLRSTLLMKVYKDYKDGDFEDAIFKAFKLLEEKVRARAGLSPSDIGVFLMDKAFNKKTGLLQHPNIIEEAEREGLRFIMRGVISLFKNPPSHKTVNWDDPNKVMRVLDFASFLLDLTDECELVKSDEKG